MSESLPNSPDTASPPPLTAGQPLILQGQVIGPDGEILNVDTAAATSDHHVTPLRGLHNALTGEWLLEILTKAAWLSGQSGLRLCGPTLSPRQRGVLESLDLLNSYISLQQPTRFGVVSVIPRTTIPPAAIKPEAEKLRNAAATPATRLAIIPQHATEAFTLANRASFAAWLRAKRFTLIEPEAMNFDALRASLATASSLIIADPRQVGLLALCQPETQILEIAPSGWLNSAGRHLSHLCGLHWQSCLAGPPTYKLLTPLPFGTRVPLSYEVAIGDLAKILQNLG